MGATKRPKGVTSEAICFIFLGLVLYGFLAGYLIVLMNTVYTHDTLNPSNIPFWTKVPSGSTTQDRWNIDYALQFIAVTLAMAVPLFAILALYVIQVGRQRMSYAFLAVAALAVVVWAVKVFIWELLIGIPACSTWGACVDEDGSSANFSPSNTYTWRLISGSFITGILVVYVFMSKPLSDLENEILILRKRD